MPQRTIESGLRPVGGTVFGGETDHRLLGDGCRGYRLCQTVRQKRGFPRKRRTKENIDDPGRVQSVSEDG